MMDLPPEPVYLQPHANILVRNFPSDYDIGSFQALFRQYAIIEGCRYFPTAAVPYAFIKLASVDAAHTAIKALHNTKLGGRTLIVKSAEQDCDYEAPINNLYCTNLPLSWNDDMLKSTFSRFGNVLSTKLLTALPGMPGKGGLVRMSTNEEAKAARDALNAIVPIGESIPIVVKFADSPEEKQRKVASKFQGGPGMPGGGRHNQRFAPYPQGGRGGGQGADGMTNSMMGGPMSSANTMMAGQQSQLPPFAAPQPNPYGQPAGSPSPWPGQPQYTSWPAPAAAAPAPAPTIGPNNIIVKGFMPDVDRLQLYELFAPFGGTMGITMQGPGSAHISYADPSTAARAVQAMNGWAYRGYPLSVSSTYHGPGAASMAGAGPPTMMMPASAPMPQLAMPAPTLPTAAPWTGY